MACALCRQDKKLCKSHIIPEWAYKLMYDESHQYLVVRPEADSKIEKRSKGEYERLLCEGCEQQLGVWEDYARAIILADPIDNKFGIETSGGEGCVYIHNVDYDRLKLFQLSVLWRASISKRPFFGGVNLGKKHEAAIHRMLFEKKPGFSNEYGCIMILFLADPRTPLSEIITEPESFHAQSHRWYIFLFAGCGWMYVVSGHRKTFKHQDLFLKPDLPLTIPLASARDVPRLLKYFDLIMRKVPRI